MFIKVRNYLASNFSTEDFRIHVRGPPANYVYGCHVTPVMRGALVYVSYQKGIIQGHNVHRYASSRAPALCSRNMFRTVLSLDVSTQTIFLYYMSVKILWGVIFYVFWYPCYTLVVMSNRWNQCNFFNPSSVIYMRAQVDSSTIVNICWLIETFKYQCIIFWALCFSYFHWRWIWHISIIHCAKFEVYTCSICDVVTIPINAFSSSFDRLKCC